jgi:hypothetical protein
MQSFPVLFPSDPVAAQDAVRAQLRAVEPSLRECIVEAFQVLRRIQGMDKLVPGALDYMRTRPKLMNSLVVASIRRAFASRREGVELTEDAGFLELRVNGAIHLRFKLVDECGRSCNAKTDAQRAYRNQLPLLGADQLDVIRLTVGWRWNVTATDLDDIGVSFEKGDEPVWKYSILRDADESGTVVALPTPEDGPAPARVRSRTRKSVSDGKGG